MTLYALRAISQNEELTINYLQDSPYLTKAQRQARLAN